MYVKWPKMSNNLFLCLESNISKVLVSKDQCTTLGSEKCELIQSGAVELGELNPMNLTANMRRQVDYRRVCAQKVWECRVCSMAWIEMLERLDAFYLLEGIIECFWDIVSLAMLPCRSVTYACSLDIMENHLGSLVGRPCS